MTTIRTYELPVVLDPRTSDDEAAELVDAIKSLLSDTGARITKEESWGKRRLAYPIEKLNEGRYFIIHLEADEGINPFPQVETRMNQNDKVLRYLAVRTDLDYKRAVRKGKQKLDEDEQEDTATEENS